MITQNVDLVLESLGVKESSIDASFQAMYDHYHKLSGMPKTDKEAAKKAFGKLNIQEKGLLKDKIQEYVNHCKTKDQYFKKFRTYLNDKNFNDEYKTTNVFTF